MKTAVKALTKVKGLGDIETLDNNSHLKHYLSPLEVAAYKHSFQKFTYHIEGEILHIEPRVAKEISSNQESTLPFCAQSFSAPDKKLKQDVQVKRFLNVPLKDHDLPTRIYHLLKQNDCNNLADVANRGEYGLKRMRGTGKQYCVSHQIV